MNFWNRITTALHLRCPRCQEGRLFTGLLTMNPTCPKCGLVLEPDPGFYLGSIYANYAATVLMTTSAFLILVFAYGFNKDVILWGCVAFTVLFPLWFFRYARSIWLSLMYFANSSDFETRTAMGQSPHRHLPQTTFNDIARQWADNDQVKPPAALPTSR